MTLIELLVVICILVVAAALLLPALAAAKPKRSRINCVNNLKQITLSFKMWAGDNDDKYPMQVSVTNGGAMESASRGITYLSFLVMSNELPTPKILICPNDTNRLAATNFTTDFNYQNISYFFGLDADDSYPQMILAGDDNLAVNGVRVRPGILNLWTNAAVGWTKERHNGAGNIALADGSAAQTTALTFQSALANTGFATNRFVIP